MSTVSVSEARATLPELLDRVLAGEEVTLTRHGQPVAVIVRPDSLRTRRAERVIDAAARLQDQLDAAQARPLSPRPSITAARAEALVAEARAGRSRRSGG